MDEATEDKTIEDEVRRAGRKSRPPFGKKEKYIDSFVGDR